MKTEFSPGNTAYRFVALPSQCSEYKRHGVNPTSDSELSAMLWASKGQAQPGGMPLRILSNSQKTKGYA